MNQQTLQIEGKVPRYPLVFLLDFSQSFSLDPNKVSTTFIVAPQLPKWTLCKKNLD